MKTSETTTNTSTATSKLVLVSRSTTSDLYLRYITPKIPELTLSHRLSLKYKTKSIELSNIKNFRKRLNTSNNESNANADILKAKYDGLINSITSLQSICDTDNATYNEIKQAITIAEYNIDSLIAYIENKSLPPHKETHRLFVTQLVISDFGSKHKDLGGARLSSINKEFDLVTNLKTLKQEVFTVKNILPSIQTVIFERRQRRFV